jgi:hypothetical protein
MVVPRDRFGLVAPGPEYRCGLGFGDQRLKHGFGTAAAQDERRALSCTASESGELILERGEAVMKPPPARSAQSPEAGHFVIQNVDGDDRSACVNGGDQTWIVRNAQVLTEPEDDRPISAQGHGNITPYRVNAPRREAFACELLLPVDASHSYSFDQGYRFERLLTTIATFSLGRPADQPLAAVTAVRSWFRT